MSDIEVYHNKYGHWPVKIKVFGMPLFEKYFFWCAENLGVIGGRWYWSSPFHSSVSVYIIFFKNEADYMWFVLNCKDTDA